MSSILKPGTVFNDTWVLGKQLGEGACGQVYLVDLVDKDKKKEPYDMIIKCSYVPKGKSKAMKEQIRAANTLFKEYQMHRGPLLGFKYAPGLPIKHRPTGEDHSYKYFVMQRLDYTLEELATCGGVPTIQTVSRIGIEVLDGLRYMHRRGYVFVDIKPDNFMILKDPSASKTRSRCDLYPDDKLFFVDFGLMEKTRSYNGPAQREDIKRNDLAGNAAYCSIDVHKCHVPTFKDDIEALGYMLLSLLNGAQLPWSTSKNAADCLNTKINTDITQLAADYGCPQMAEFILLLRKLSYDDEPDYEQLHSILMSLPENTVITKTIGRKRSGKVSTDSTLNAMNANGKKSGKFGRQSTRKRALQEDDDSDKEMSLPKKMTSESKAISKQAIQKSAPKKKCSKAKRTKIIDINSDDSGPDEDYGRKHTKRGPHVSEKTLKVVAKRGKRVQDTEVIVVSSGEEDVETENDEERTPVNNASRRSARLQKNQNQDGGRIKKLKNDVDDDEEEDESEDTPVKAKEHKVTSPSPFLKRKIAAKKAVTRDTSNSQKEIGPFGGKCSDNDDSEEDERGNTPIKAKPVTVASSSSDISLQRPVSQRTTTKKLDVNDNDERCDEKSSSSTVKTISNRFTGRRRAASSPFLSKDDTLPLPSTNLHHKENIESLSCKSAQNVRGSESKIDNVELYMKIITSDHAPYRGMMWPLNCIGSNSSDKSRGNSWGKIQVGRESCDITLENDSYLSSSHAMVQPVVNQSRKRRRASKEQQGNKDMDISINVQDLSSSNGTKVNGVKIKPFEWVTANLGDTIQLGSTKVEIVAL